MFSDRHLGDQRARLARINLSTSECFRGPPTTSRRLDFHFRGGHLDRACQRLDSPGASGEMVGKEEKTAEEIVALFRKELKIPGVYLEVFRHRHVGWYATALPGLLPAWRVQPDVERIVEHLRTLYDLKR